ncbi:MAG: PHB depolymerase family esterase [Oligoflexia bacterium]|nr:PHB depolymerase family esterase [Oligoflexia bacterium]
MMSRKLKCTLGLITILAASMTLLTGTSFAQSIGCLPGLPCSSDGNSSGGNASSNWPGQWTHDSFSGSTGSRDYYLYTPKNTHGQAALPLLVMLHGCSEDAQSFAAQTGMNDIAEQFGFVVVYPEQTSQYNMMRCWNWFQPDSQARDSGELAIVVGIIQKVESATPIDGNRIYAAGISAGGGLVSNLLACYSDVFSGGGVASGLDYEAATSQMDAFTVMSSGPSNQDIPTTAQDAIRCTGRPAHPVAVLSIHGSSDPFVSPVNQDKVVEQFTAINDLLDDGQANNSQNMNVISSNSGQVPNGGYAYTVSTYGGNGTTHIGKITVSGMGHAWSGAKESGQFADPKGPNYSLMLWQFLSQFAVGRSN